MREATTAALEKPHMVWFWGAEHRVTPRVVEERFGDGHRLIFIEPLDTRPNYYCVWVDSGWRLNNWDEGEVLIDHLDEIEEAILDQFGPFGDEWDGWPQANFDSGCRWGLLPAPADGRCAWATV